MVTTLKYELQKVILDWIITDLFSFRSERQELRNSLLFTDWKSWEELLFFQLYFHCIVFRFGNFMDFCFTFPIGIQVYTLARLSCWVNQVFCSSFCGINQVFCSIFHRALYFQCLFKIPGFGFTLSELCSERSFAWRVIPCPAPVHGVPKLILA